MGENDFTYTLDWYANRRIATSAGSLLPHIHPGMSLLDCGCGPGSITLDFAEVLAPGEVVGVDIEDETLARAKATSAERNLPNVRFEKGDIYDLRSQTPASTPSGRHRSFSGWTSRAPR